MKTLLDEELVKFKGKVNKKMDVVTSTNIWPMNWGQNLTPVFLTYFSQPTFQRCGSANWHCFHVPCTLPFTVYFHNVISVLRTSIYVVIVTDCTRKQTLLIKLFYVAFTKDLPSISQSNEQTVISEKEEQYTLSNMIFIKLPNSCFYFFEVYFEARKMYTNQWNNICNGVHFFVCSFTKNMHLYKYFSRFFLRFVL